MSVGLRAPEPMLAALLLSVAAIAPRSPAKQQSTTPPSVEVNSVNELSVGTTICVALARTIDAKNAKAGDAISARVTLPVLAKGKVFLPNDAKITGHVVSVRRRSDNEASKVAIVFDHATLKDGSQVALPLTVQAIGKSAFTAEDLSDGDGPSPLSPSPRSGPSSSARVPGMTSPPLTREPPTPIPPSTDSPETPHPALDTGSHGAVGLPNLRLTESADATSGSVIRATKKNVKLETGMEMILRVVEPVKPDRQAGEN